jgi:hypothetical protein
MRASFLFYAGPKAADAASSAKADGGFLYGGFLS